MKYILTICCLLGNSIFKGIATSKYIKGVSFDEPNESDYKRIFNAYIALVKVKYALQKRIFNYEITDASYTQSRQDFLHPENPIMKPLNELEKKDINQKIETLEDFIYCITKLPCSANCPQIREFKLALLTRVEFFHDAEIWDYTKFDNVHNSTNRICFTPQAVILNIILQPDFKVDDKLPQNIKDFINITREKNNLKSLSLKDDPIEKDLLNTGPKFISNLSNAKDLINRIKENIKDFINITREKNNLKDDLLNTELKLISNSPHVIVIDESTNIINLMDAFKEYQKTDEITKRENIIKQQIPDDSAINRNVDDAMNKNLYYKNGLYMIKEKKVDLKIASILCFFQWYNGYSYILNYVLTEDAKPNAQNRFYLHDADYVFEKSSYYDSIDELKEESETDTINLMKKIIESNLKITEANNTEITQANYKNYLNKEINKSIELVKQINSKPISNAYIALNKVKYALQKRIFNSKITIDYQTYNHSMAYFLIKESPIMKALDKLGKKNVNQKIETLEDFIYCITKLPCSANCPQIREFKLALLTRVEFFHDAEIWDYKSRFDLKRDNVHNFKNRIFFTPQAVILNIILQPDFKVDDKLPQNIKDFIIRRKTQKDHNDDFVFKPNVRVIDESTNIINLMDAFKEYQKTDEITKREDIIKQQIPDDSAIDRNVDNKSYMAKIMSAFKVKNPIDRNVDDAMNKNSYYKNRLYMVTKIKLDEFTNSIRKSIFTDFIFIFFQWYNGYSYTLNYVPKENAQPDKNSFYNSHVPKKNDFYKVSDVDYFFEKSSYYDSIDALKEKSKTDTINLMKKIIESNLEIAQLMKKIIKPNLEIAQVAINLMSKIIKPNLEIAQVKNIGITQANEKTKLDNKIAEVIESVKNSEDKDLNIYASYPRI